MKTCFGRCSTAVNLPSDISRRKALGTLATLGALGTLLCLEGKSHGAPRQTARACIVLWLNGGPSHVDTFDPKPGTSSGGPFKDIPTKVKELRLCEHLPQLAEQADRFSIIRSLSSKEGNHDRARALLHTGYSPDPTVDHPSLGSHVSALGDGKKSELPSYISIRGPGADAGFLGVEHAPFLIERPGDPPANTDYPAGVDFGRFVKRRQALAFLEGRLKQKLQDPGLAEREAVTDKAVRMMYAPRLSAFDLRGESDSLRKAYGDHDFGRGCLLARRLVESGVRFVEVTLDGWDTHKDNFTALKKQMGILDPALATLLTDLAERNLLDSTLIVCMGEFGRTPKINKDEGRDHHPQAFSALLAGGGIRPGVVHGATDAQGDKVTSAQVSIPNLFATLCVCLGIDPEKELRSPQGRPLMVTKQGQPIRSLLAGR